MIWEISKPIDYKEIWNDSGSGADDDVAIYSLTPPSSEYKCLGHVATNREAPILSNYRCVRNDFLGDAPVKSSSTWDDSGSGADANFGAFTIYYEPGITIKMGLFWSHNYHDNANYKWAPALKNGPAVHCDPKDGPWFCWIWLFS